MSEKPELTKREHWERHMLLHTHLDELSADWIRATGNLPSEHTVMELMHWSFEQIKLLDEQLDKEAV
jgi:hypothetical protein